MKEVWQTYTDNKKSESPSGPAFFKTYNVMVYSSSYTYIATGYLVVLFFLIPVVAGRFLSINTAIVLLAAMVLGLLVVLKLAKGLFTEQKEIELFNDKVVIKGKDTATVPFDEIKNYNTTWARNTVNLIIRLKNGGKIKLGYSSLYGDISELEKLVADFETQMNKVSLSNTGIGKREKSFIERPWMIALLIVWTVLMFANIGIAFYIHKPVPLGIWVSSGLVSVYWSLYISTRNRNKGIRPTNKNIMDLHRELNKNKD